MKKIIFIIAALMLSVFAASAQDVLGNWNRNRTGISERRQLQRQDCMASKSDRG